MNKSIFQKTENFSIGIADRSHSREISKLSMKANPDFPISASMVLRLLTMNNVMGFNVRFESQIIAFCIIVIKKQKKKARILYLYIDPDFVSSAMGNILLSTIEQFCSCNNIINLSIEVMQGSPDYVTLVKRGYITVSEVKNHFGEMFRMQKLLPEFEKHQETMLRKLLRKVHAI